jgi:hypothetical protein
MSRGRAPRKDGVTSQVEIERAQREAEILQMRLQGWSLQAIGDAQNPPLSSVRVHVIIRDALSRTLTEPLEQARVLEVARLNEMLTGVYEKAAGGDLLAISSALSILQRRAKLIGLDAPAIPGGGGNVPSMDEKPEDKPLDDVKHEKFAQEIAKGRKPSDAYVAAGFKRHEGNASRLRNSEPVKARVSAILAKVAVNTEITVESLIAEVDEARIGAMKAGQYGVAIAATREKGVLSGKRIERAEVGKPGDFSRMTDNELDAFIAERERTLRTLAQREGASAQSSSSVESSRRLN